LWLTSNWNKRLRQQDKGRFYYNLAFNGKMPKEIKSFMQATWYYRMGSLYALNEMIEQIIAELKAKNEWNNTMLIFTSDNGFHLGSKGLYHKGTPYEEAIRVPLIIAGGDSLYLNTPGKTEEWVINLDLMATLLELVGIPIAEDIDGKSILSLIRKTSQDNYKPRESFIMEYLSPGGTDFIFGGPTLNIKLFPSPLLDRPSYNAIRIIQDTMVNGVKQREVFKYIEWQKNYGMKKFRGKLESQDPKLMEKISRSNERILKKKLKAEEIETELYNLTRDPYEMDNLLFYQPQQYQELAKQLQAALYKEIGKR
jgi:arylsulfatase A-like enzyme